MSKGTWVSMEKFRLEQVDGHIAGKWEALYYELEEQVAAVNPPEGIAVAFEDEPTAKRAAAAVVKMFTERRGSGAIKTAVRAHNDKPCLLVWKGDLWRDDD